MSATTTFYMQEITIERINLIQDSKKLNKSSIIKIAIDYLYKAMENKTKECVKMEMLIEKIKLTLDSLELDTRTRNELDLTLESMKETMQDINKTFDGMRDIYNDKLDYIPHIQKKTKSKEIKESSND